jgi:hypothetical protein
MKGICINLQLSIHAAEFVQGKLAATPTPAAYGVQRRPGQIRWISAREMNTIRPDTSAADSSRTDKKFRTKVSPFKPILWWRHPFPVFIQALDPTLIYSPASPLAADCPFPFPFPFPFALTTLRLKSPFVFINKSWHHSLSTPGQLLLQHQHQL